MKQLKNEEQEVFIEVKFLEQKKILHANWIGSYLSVEQVKKGGLLIIEEVLQNKCLLLMTDNRELEGVWDEANEWIATEWMPKVIQAGLVKMAHILSQDLFAQLSAEFMVDNTKEIENMFQLKMFNSQEDAETWLLQE